MIRKSSYQAASGLIVLVGMACLAAAGSAEGGSPDLSRPEDRAESLSGWQSVHEVPLPETGQGGLADFLLTPEVFGEARADLGDLRLYDANGREVPYALRIRHKREEEEILDSKVFDQRRNHDDRSEELSLDLGLGPIECQMVELTTNGEDFRRRVLVESSGDGTQWATVAEAWIAFYPAENVSIRRVKFPTCRLRYLRLRVFPDLGKPDDLPEVTQASAYHTVEIPGEYVTLPVVPGPWEPVRAYGGPGSAWIFALGKGQVPCERLTFDVGNDDFVRPYHLEKVEPENRYSQIVNGQLRRRAGGERRPSEIEFSEVVAGQLRLVVTDYRNAPLELSDVRYTAAARQVVFARGSELAGPLRLYVGNPKAQPPHYEFADGLPPVLDPAPVRANLGEQKPNPEYRPEPKPWTDRWPWLVYVVLGVASAVLLSMLAALARHAVRQHDAAAGAAAQDAPIA